jgi:hypothetical protein
MPAQTGPQKTALRDGAELAASTSTLQLDFSVSAAQGPDCLANAVDADNAAHTRAGSVLSRACCPGGGAAQGRCDAGALPRGRAIHLRWQRDSDSCPGRLRLGVESLARAPRLHHRADAWGGRAAGPPGRAGRRVRRHPRPAALLNLGVRVPVRLEGTGREGSRPEPSVREAPAGPTPDFQGPGGRVGSLHCRRLCQPERRPMLTRVQVPGPGPWHSTDSDAPSPPARLRLAAAAAGCHCGGGGQQVAAVNVEDWSRWRVAPASRTPDSDAPAATGGGSLVRCWEAGPGAVTVGELRTPAPSRRGRMSQ